VREAAARAAALATGGDTAGAAAAGAPGDAEARGRGGVRLDGAAGRSIARGDDPPLGAGDVRVVSSDGGMVLALVGDTVRLRMGDSLLTKVRRDLDAGADTVAGLGGFVARTVKGAVGGAMTEAARYAVLIPVAEVHDLRYEDGELRVNADRRNGTKSSARFARADAERFIGAVRARQRALGVPVAGR
jgi:hypothetical protein